MFVDVLNLVFNLDRWKIVKVDFGSENRNSYLLELLWQYEERIQV